MKKEKKVWAMTLIAFWWLAPNQTNAQQDSTSQTALQEVTVTATKFAKSQSETGKVLTIIDENQIKLSAGKDISQLLNEQTGLFINGANSNPGKDKSVYLRGARSEYTVILLDGIPLNDPSSIGGGAYDLRMIPLDQVERIEILKGNQSTLYGSNAISGVINIITKRDGDKPVRGSATLSYGSFNTKKGSVSVSGSTSKVDYSVGASRFLTDGVSEANDTLGTANFDNDGVTQNSFNANITFKPFKAFQIQPYFRYADFDGSYDGGPFTDNPRNTYGSSFHNTGINSEYQLKKGSIHFYYGYDKTNRVFVDSSYGFTSTYNYKGRFHHGEIFLNCNFGKQIQLLSGAGYQSWLMLDEAATKVNPSVTLISPYASFFVRNLKGFSAELGGRYNHHSRYGNNFTFSFNPSWLIRERAKIFFNVSSGFKAPSLQQLFGQYGANENLKPEKSQSMEGGAQFFFKQKDADIRVVAFQRKIEDVIFYSNSGYINQNEQNDKGFDLEGTFAPIKNLKLKTFYSLVIGSTSTENSITTKILYRIPKHSFGVNMSYKILPNWMVSANFRITGKRNDLFYDSQIFGNRTVNLKAYHLLDFYTEYSLLKGKLKLFADAKNLLNQDYYEVYGYSVLPVSVNAGVSVSL